MAFELKQDLALAAAFAIIGFIVTLKPLILALAKLNPWQGLLVFYAILFIVLFLLSRLGLTVFNVKIRSIPQIIGTMMIFFAFFVVFNWTNAYVQYVTTGSFGGASVIFYMAEDGALWFLYSQLIPLTSYWTIQLVRLLTFVITPFVLVFIGGFLTTGKARLGGI